LKEIDLPIGSDFEMDLGLRFPMLTAIATGFRSVMGWHSRIGLATGSDFGSRWLMDFEMGFDWPKLTDFGSAIGLRSCLGWCLPMVRKRGLIPLPPKPTNYHSRCYNLP